MHSPGSRWLMAVSWAVSVAGVPTELSRRLSPKTIKYGVIGDSWASGVTYGLFGYTNYDDNASGCMRINHAYGVQLRDDWPFPGKGDLTFAACSGAILSNMILDKPQINNLPEDVDFITMQAGGNDVGFYNLARDCIFHNERSVDYGAEYPDATGACAKSIASSRDDINKPPSDIGLWKWVDDTIKDALDNDRAKRAGFKLYVLGYAHLFNVDSPDSDWCNEESFSVSPTEFYKGGRPKLSNAVRVAINDLTTLFNDRVQEVVRWRNDPRVRYVSVTEGYKGHRFCERDHNRYDQYFGSNVWFWNASPDGLFPQSDTQGQSDIDTTWTQVYNQTFVYQPNADAFNWDDLLQMEKGPHAQSPHQGMSPGVALRPFHPKADGHRVIKDSLKPMIQKDFFQEALGLPIPINIPFFNALYPNGTNGSAPTGLLGTGTPSSAKSSALPSVQTVTFGHYEPVTSIATQLPMTTVSSLATTRPARATLPVGIEGSM